MDSFDNDVRVPQLRDIRVIDPDRQMSYTCSRSVVEEEQDAPSTLNLCPERTGRPMTWASCGRGPRYQIISNILIVSFAFVLNFTAFQSMQNLQTSLNRVDGLGAIGLSVIYACVILSSLFLPSFFIKHLGCKWTMVYCIVPYICYMAANFYATWWTILPTAAFLGLAAAPLWTAQCTYFTTAAKQYASLSGETETAIKSRFFGIFFTAFQSTVLWGSLIVTFLLHKAPDSNNWFAGVSRRGTEKCGAFYCSDLDVQENSNLDRPNIIKVYTLCGTYVGLGVLSMLCIILLLDKKPYKENGSPHDMVMIPPGPATINSSNNAHSPVVVQCSLSSQHSAHGHNNTVTAYLGQPETADKIWYPGMRRSQRPYKRTCVQRCISCCGLLMQTVNHLRYMDQLLLIPITVFSGLEQAFFSADFTKIYVSCSLGVWAIGLVLICYGAVDMLASLVLGYLVKYTGRLPVFILGALVHCALIVGLFIWKPSADQLFWFFLMAGLWGLADAVWQTQINALYSSLFAEQAEAAFSNYKLWESTGFIVSFLYSSYICVSYKIIILLSVLTLGMLGYMVVEFRTTRAHSQRLLDEAPSGNSHF